MKLKQISLVLIIGFTLLVVACRPTHECDRAEMVPWRFVEYLPTGPDTNVVMLCPGWHLSLQFPVSNYGDVGPNVVTALPDHAPYPANHDGFWYRSQAPLKVLGKMTAYQLKIWNKTH